MSDGWALPIASSSEGLAADERITHVANIESTAFALASSAVEFGCILQQMCPNCISRSIAAED